MLSMRRKKNCLTQVVGNIFDRVSWQFQVSPTKKVKKQDVLRSFHWSMNWPINNEWKIRIPGLKKKKEKMEFLLPRFLVCFLVVSRWPKKKCWSREVHSLYSLHCWQVVSNISSLLETTIFGQYRFHLLWCLLS